MGSIQLYTGPWDFESAKHLLSRAMFAPSYEQITWSVQQGLEATIDQLLQPNPLPEPPINAFYDEDPEVAIGSTWVHARYEEKSVNEGINYRQRSLTAWTIKTIFEEGISAREKLTLFFHNHFAINSVLDERYLYRYISTIREKCLGDYRALTKAIAIDPSMLRYLNGRQNKRQAPNENFARELLELFTVGKGPQAGPGDYSHYTEKDIVEIARSMTGWYDVGYTDTEYQGEIGAQFNIMDHSEGVKELSVHFNAAQIPDLLDQEYAYVIDVIFTSAQASRFLAEKLFRWFVHYDTSLAGVDQFLEDLADTVREEQFNISAILTALWKSDHFYEMRYRATMIKNPMDFIMGILKTGDLHISNTLDEEYDSFYRIFDFLGKMQMEYFDIPEAAGWKAYYRSPLYSRNWINATTLPIRMQLVDDLLVNGLYPFMTNGERMFVRFLPQLVHLPEARDPDFVIEFLQKITLHEPLKKEEQDRMKAILLDGLPDFEWTVQFESFIAQPTPDVEEVLNLRINRALQYAFRHPVFQLH